MRYILQAAIILLATVSSLFALDNWTNWRGPKYSGAAVGKEYPTNWSKTENVRWTFDLPGPGSSTPSIWQDRIFLTCGVSGKNAVLCLSRDGKQLWQTLLSSEKAGKHKKATGSNPSTVTDGKHVWAYFKSGELACLDVAGKVIWTQNTQTLYGEDSLWWDLGTSPVLTTEHVIVTVMQTGPSYLAAFDRLTGKVAWKVDRTTEAPSESAQSYSTPIQIQHQGQEQLIVLGADCVTAHEAATGKEIWRVNGLNPEGQKLFRSIASPVVSGGMVIAPYARGNSLTGIKLGGVGNVTESHVIWKRNGLGTDVPTPTGGGDRVYLLTDKGEIHCLDALTGKTYWSGQPEKNRSAFSASPVMVDGKIFVIREDGAGFVVGTGNQFEVLGKSTLDGETVVATPVFVDGQIFIRTRERMYCIAK